MGIFFYCLTSIFMSSVLLHGVETYANEPKETKITGEILSGPLEFKDPPKNIAFEADEIDGSDMKYKEQFDMTISDYRGSSNGFRLYVRSTESKEIKGAKLSLTAFSSQNGKYAGSDPDSYRLITDALKKQALWDGDAKKIGVSAFVEKWRNDSIRWMKYVVEGNSISVNSKFAKLGEGESTVSLRHIGNSYYLGPLNPQLNIKAELSIPKRAKAGVINYPLVWSFVASP